METQIDEIALYREALRLAENARLVRVQELERAFKNRLEPLLGHIHELVWFVNIYSSPVAPEKQAEMLRHVAAVQELLAVPDPEIKLLLERATVLALGDELVTIAEAARLAGKTVARISRLASRGVLTTYNNPDAHNPRRGRRLVNRTEVKLLLPR